MTERHIYKTTDEFLEACQIGSFSESLFHLFTRADVRNRAKLSKAFPGHAELFRIWLNGFPRDEPEPLRQVAGAMVRMDFSED